MSPPSSDGAVLRVRAALCDELAAYCLRGFPEESCGLLGGDPAGTLVDSWYPARNATSSARRYLVDAHDELLADQAAQASEREIVGVFHSHTHTDPYPSATDLAEAPDPGWHYLIISLRHEVASVRAFRITDGVATEESLEPI